MNRNWIIPAGVIAAGWLFWFRRARPALPGGMEEPLSLDMTAFLAQVDEENEQYVVLASELAAEAGIPQEGFMQQIWIESRFDPDAVGPMTANYGRAKGLAQFVDITAAEYGINPFNPEQSLRAAIEYMKHWHNYYERRGHPYPWSLALFAYNAGPGTTNKWLAGSGGIRGETSNYIQVIARHYGENPPVWV